MHDWSTLLVDLKNLKFERTTWLACVLNAGRLQNLNVVWQILNGPMAWREEQYLFVEERSTGINKN